MELRDILNDAIDLAGVPISDKQFILAYNRVCHDLAMIYDTAKARVQQIIICDDVQVEYPLTEGCFRIERVLNSGGGYMENFTTRGNTAILFTYAGTYTVYETLVQDSIVSMDDTVSINSAYLKPIAEFIAARALRKVSPEYTTLAGKKVMVSMPDSYQNFMEQYTTDAALVNQNIRRAVNPNRQVRAPLFR